ncbi:MAG TPA: hypothetical protein VKU83_03950, partial [Puia sp.]|nr:hypothetical protein [Puia sp.]
MKSAYITIAIAGLLALPGFGQVKTQQVDLSSQISKQSIDELPFRKGNWEFPLMQNFGYSHQSISEQGQSYGHQENFKLDLGAKYFFSDHLGVGLNLNMRS